MPVVPMRLRDLPNEYNVISGQVLDAAIEVHSALGPGLLEHSYRDFLAHELRLRGFDAIVEQDLAVEYKGLTVKRALRTDIVVNDKLIIELKTSPWLPEHEAKLIAYLRLSKRRLGFLFNFHAQRIRDDFRRLIV